MRKVVLAFPVLLLACCLEAAAPEDVVAIIGVNSPLAGSGFGAPDLRDAYLGNLRFWKGVKVSPVDHEDRAVQAAFVEKYLGMGPSEYRGYWLKKSFADGVQAPRSAGASADVLRTVSENPGAIGYVRAGDLNSSLATLLITDFRVIVNAANPATSVSRHLLKDAFSGLASKWPNGLPVSPVDLPLGNPVRVAFSRAALAMSPEQVAAATSKRPDAAPLPVRSYESHVISSVAENPGAVGYVSGSVRLVARVKSVPIRD
ncbi:MAG TPA: hypothetical protein VJU18_06915 [Vicinamibacteria bacterium]|nr:hypothetical protein [Vicinamibacteria bacterium]